MKSYDGSSGTHEDRAMMVVAVHMKNYDGSSGNMQFIRIIVIILTK